MFAAIIRLYPRSFIQRFGRQMVALKQKLQVPSLSVSVMLPRRSWSCNYCIFYENQYKRLPADVRGRVLSTTLDVYVLQLTS
jgi:hypothetical protein